MSEWENYFKHKCGATARGNYNQVEALCCFGHVCPSCGESSIRCDYKTFVGRMVSTAIWWNPLTWLNEKLEVKEK